MLIIFFEIYEMQQLKKMCLVRLNLGLNMLLIWVLHHYWVLVIHKIISEYVFMRRLPWEKNLLLLLCVSKRAKTASREISLQFWYSVFQSSQERSPANSERNKYDFFYVWVNTPLCWIRHVLNCILHIRAK